MVPDSTRPGADDSTEAPPTRETDGGAAVGFDGAALYTVVRDAVKDALLDVIGTLALVAIGFVLVVAGSQAVIRSSGLTGAVVGVAVGAFGLYVAAAALELLPPVREWY